MSYKLTENPSPEVKAVMFLLHAQRYVEGRCDGAWWLLDKARQELMTLLLHNGTEEHRFVVSLIHLENIRRAERLS